MTVYAVHRSSGSWDDYTSWVENVYADKVKAQQVIDKKNAQIDRLKEYSNPKAEDHDHPEWIRHYKISELGKLWIKEFNVIES